MGTANRKEPSLDGMQRKYLNDQTREMFKASKSGDAVLLNKVLQQLNSSERASALETKMAASVLEGEVHIGQNNNLWLDWYGTYNTTPLIVSVENGNLDCVNVLLKYKADIEGRGDDFAWYHQFDEDLKSPSYIRSFTPLFVAAAKGNLDILSCLIENGADVNSHTADCTPLMMACRKGHFNVVSFLIKHGANPELQDNNGYTALHHAVVSRNCDSCDILSCLIKNGADVNVRARDTCTPLMTAVKKGRVDVVTFLIEHGANMTLIDKNGFTALHHATSHDHEILSCLIRNGADVNACTNENYTPLMIAVEEGNKIAVTHLLEHGADINVQATAGGKKALHLAVTRHDSRYILNCLIKNGADVNSRTSMSKTPLMLANKCGHVNAVTLLIKCGADVDLRDPTGQTALHYAVYQDHDSCDVLSCLIKKGTDVNACTNDNCTSLMIASKNNHINIATFLVEHGANIDLQDKEGNTALHYAVSANLPEVANTLLSLGASQLCNNRQLTPLLLASNECKISMVEELIKRPECTKEQRIDALELLGASLVTSTEKDSVRFFEATGKGFQYIRHGMEERFADLSHPLFKKPLEQFEAFENGRESQTLEDLSWIKGDIDAIIIESLMIRERILGRDNAELLFVIRRIAECHVRYQLNGDLAIALYRHAMKIAQSCNQSAISDLNILTSLLYNLAWCNDHPKQYHILELLEQTVLEYDKQQKLRRGIENESYEFKTCRDFELCGLFGSTVKLVQIIAKLKYCEAGEDSCVSLLLKRLCHLNPRGFHGGTLLHKAIEYHGTNAFPFIDTVKLLLNAGIDVNAIDNSGDTPLHRAVTFVPSNKIWSHESIHHLTDMLEVLLDGGAHHDFVNNDGKTAMDMAERDEACMILLEKRKLELKCISARAVKKFGLPYLGMVPKTLEKYISRH